ncbi:MAG: biotin transporter BioY, partial [Clostridia bacterium]|nr:biotin transporter BioY [Clostridia bacterium]
MKLKELTLSAVLTALCAVCAWITVPFTVPFTMQTFAVFLTCLLLGGKNATMVMAAYLSLGALGVPVFSGMNGGVGVLFGPTGGYLIGFLLLCPVYALVTHFWPGRKAGKAAGLLSGLLVLYAFGTVWFVFRYAGGEIGFGGALLCCVAPFVIPD